MTPSMPATSPAPTSGCVVQCRSHRWLVEEVEPAEHPEGDTVVRMACLDDDANAALPNTRTCAAVPAGTHTLTQNQPGTWRLNAPSSWYR